MRLAFRLFFVLLSVATMAKASEAAEPTRITAEKMQQQHLRPGTSTYFVYMHGAPDTGIKGGMLSTTDVFKEIVGGEEAWVIEQKWESETGVIHTARTVHAMQDLSTRWQTSEWFRPGGSFGSTVFPQEGRGEIRGEPPPPTRKKMEEGFAAMKGGWWMNWHSDLTLLPLLPYEAGGTLRVRVFDVGMAAPIDVDYVVVGDRQLRAVNGESYDCWLVETESGSPGAGNYQRFWIDKVRRIVVKEEDVFNGSYRTKILLSVPARTEFAASGENASSP